MEGVGLGCGSRGGPLLKDDMDGWVEGFRRSGRHAGAPPKLLGNGATIEGDEERPREQRGKDKPCLQWRDLAGLPLLCLSGSGLQRQRKSRNVQAWWWWWWWIGTSSASALKRPGREKVLSNDCKLGFWKDYGNKTQNKRFSSFWMIFCIGDIGHDQVSETKSVAMSDKLTCNFKGNKVAGIDFFFPNNQTTSLTLIRLDVWLQSLLVPEEGQPCAKQEVCVWCSTLKRLCTNQLELLLVFLEKMLPCQFKR